MKEMERDEEEKYFNSLEDDGERDPENNTGIQDF